MSDNQLMHFVQAQAPVYDTVRSELRAGTKTSHWMWFIFPQLGGLGQSAMAKRFAIADLEHARRYLIHPILGRRLMECTRLVLGHHGKSVNAIFGSPDDMKFHSCITLFSVASEAAKERALFERALDRYFRGSADSKTLAILRGQHDS